jgi:hypothetical protein
MRKTLTIADGRGVVTVSGRRAVVRVDGRYVGQATKCGGGRWAVPGADAAFRGPVDAAEALADGYGQAA